MVEINRTAVKGVVRQYVRYAPIFHDLRGKQRSTTAERGHAAVGGNCLNFAVNPCDIKRHCTLAIEVRKLKIEDQLSLQTKWPAGKLLLV
jgi:hypothetical protein